MAAVLARTPLEVRPRKMPVALDKYDSVSDTLPPPMSPTVKVTPDQDIAAQDQPAKSFYAQNLQMHPLNLAEDTDKKKNFSLDVTSAEADTAKEDIHKSDSNEYLSPSPVFRFANYDSQSFDMLTPDDLANNSFLMGLSNINYDIEFSDASADNSVNDDVSPEKVQRSPIRRDPFSPVDNGTFLIAQEPLVPTNVQTRESSACNNNCESVKESEKLKELLIDKVQTDSPMELPSPIKPVSSEYSGFSRQGWQIPSIPCNTGDYGTHGGTQGTTQAAEVDTVDGTVEPKSETTQPVEDTAVKILGNVLETFDKLF